MQKPYTSYNPFFLIPFIIWVIVGGVLLLSFDTQTLFKAVNSTHNSFLDVFMYRATMLGEGAVITLVLLILLAISSYRNWWYFTAAIFSNILPSILTQVIKRNVGAPRPLKYFEQADWVHSLPIWPQLMENSFPSGHTCGAFTLFTFLAILLKPKYKFWGFVFFLLALLVAYTRMYLAVHFFADVYVGSIIGTLCTIIIIALMNRYQRFFFKRS